MRIKARASARVRVGAKARARVRVRARVRADGDEPVGQRADDAGLQREGDERRDAEGLVAHRVEVGAVLSVVHQVVLTVDARSCSGSGLGLGIVFGFGFG